MGYVIDHLPQTKMGRFRSYIIIGTIITTAVFLMMWLGPSLAPTGKMAIAFISYILFGFVFDLMDIPLNAMIPVMSAYDNDRNILSNIKGIAYAVGGMVIYIVTIPIVSSFATQRQGYHVLIIGASIFVLVFSILGTLGIRERVYPVSEQAYKFRDVLRIIVVKTSFCTFCEYITPANWKWIDTRYTHFLLYLCVETSGFIFPCSQRLYRGDYFRLIHNP
jgi:Na+/melibiose symporter-like transporter